ncbi:MAG: glucosyltransferase domain-containing protein [Clostridia bacterium]|nr:glucosyltransferase domain-containing protein [Clostridia bacterium]
MKKERPNAKRPAAAAAQAPRKVRLSGAPDRGENARAFVFLLLGNLVAYLPLCVFHGKSYSFDSPAILVKGDWVHYGGFIDSYRYIGALVYKIYSLTGHNPIENSTPDIVLFILLAAVGTAAFVYALRKRLKIEGVLPLAAIELAVLLSVENAWFSAILTFPESIFLAGVGLVCCFCALIVFMRRRSVWTWLLSAVLLLCAVATYQQYLSVFIIFAIAIVSAELTAESGSRPKNVFLAYFKTAVFLAATCAVYFAVGKAVAKTFDIAGSTRTALTLEAIMENIRYFATHQRSFLWGRGTFKTEILTAAFLSLGGLWFVCLLVFTLKKKEFFKAGLIAASYAAAYVSGYLLGLISVSHENRALFALFSIFFLFTLGIVAKSPKKLLSAVPACILAVVFAANVFVIIRTGNNHRLQNAADIDCAERISEAIDAYEKTSGVTVTKLAYCRDAAQEPEHGDSLFYYDYALEPLLTLKSSRYTPGVEKIYTFSDVPEQIYGQYFAGKDWHSLDLEEQLIIIDDTAYLCVY